MKRRTRTRTPLGIATLMMCASVLFALAVSEAFVRVFVREPILPRFVLDAGYGVRDNMRDVRTRHTSPGDYAVAVTTNSQGMRNAQREYRTGRNVHAYRIALVGDSFVFGYGVGDDQVVSARLEDLLNERGTGKYEVLNFGVPGFGQSEELLLYWNKVRSYEPDAVMLFYFSNDLGNNVVSGLFAVDSMGVALRTGHAYLPGVVMRERLYAFAPTRWLFEHSELWNAVRNRLSLMIQRSLVEARGMRSFNSETPNSILLTRAVLQRFVAELHHDNVLPVVFVIPTRELTTNFPFTSHEVLEMRAEFVDGRNHLAVQDYFDRDTHWRASGHEKAARALAHLLEARTAAP